MIIVEPSSTKHLCNTCNHRDICAWREKYLSLCRDIYDLQFCIANYNINKAEPHFIEECEKYDKQGKPESAAVDSKGESSYHGEAVDKSDDPSDHRQ